MDAKEVLERLRHYYVTKNKDTEDGRFNDEINALTEAIDSITEHGSPRAARAAKFMSQLQGAQKLEIHVPAPE